MPMIRTQSCCISFKVCPTRSLLRRQYIGIAQTKPIAAIKHAAINPKNTQILACGDKITFKPNSNATVSYTHLRAHET
ncbi:hypothetical protein, partial [Kingella kingae]|uniref:hypothetical protein n=1 Tax=Kingella kingae TaxID=504 RepID=UPI002556899E